MTKQARPKRTAASKSIIQTRILPPEAFKQALLKYSNRQAKTGRPFGVVSIQLTNPTILSQEEGGLTLSQLQGSCSKAIAATLRDMDRLCVQDNGWFFILLPETTAEGASHVVARLQDLVNTTTFADGISPRFRLRCAHSQQHDLQEMLVTVGAEIDEHGSLIPKAPPAFTWFAAGSLASWQERYEKETVQKGQKVQAIQQVERRDWHGVIEEHILCKDVWRKNKKVEMHVVTRGDSTAFSRDVQEQLMRKSHALQAVQHPGVQPLIDFYLNREQQFIFIVDALDAPVLKEYIAGRNLSAHECLELIDQILGVAMCLSTAVPSVAPVTIQPESLLFSPGDQHVKLCHYHGEVLFGSEDADSGDVRLKQSLAVIFEEIISSGKGKAPEAAQLIESLKSEKAAAGVTLYKARSIVRRAMGNCTVSRAAGR